MRRSLWYCLKVLAARGHDPIPEVRAALRPRRLFPVERRILARVARRECSVHIRYGFTLACLPRWADRVKFARQLLFPADGVHAAGFADAGPSPRHAWVAHWGSLVRLVTHQGFRGRPE
ncbi:MAG: hypothetical protein A2Z31_06545 [candidate division NC10 bacterium RBG_16_65_8]|nr:MAG: hypothetical protein A2Z31_06545 [candidate division NC10 bacterium RBG_16_65_8]